jgi:excisionase family DNA binding protein
LDIQGRLNPECLRHDQLELDVSPRPEESLRYIARLLGDVRRRYRANGTHFPIELEAAFLVSSGLQRPEVGDSSPTDDCLAMNYEVVARRLSVSERHVRRLVAQGDLPMVKLGGASRIAVADLEAYVEGLERSRGVAA